MRFHFRGRPHHAGPLAIPAAVVLCGLLVAMTGGGCSASNPHPTGSFDRAVFFAEKGKDLEAVSAFESFVRQNPTDSLAAEAQYLKAMTYMDLEEYPLAAVEFQILRKDYPTSERVEDALFQEGKAYLLQVDRVERDLTGAYEARLHFLDFSQRYPASPHMPEIVGHMQAISDLMVRKRLEQIKVYKQLKRWEAIAVVLDGVLQDEAGSSLLPEVLWERARVAERLDDPDTAAAMYQQLLDRYRDSSYGKRAERALGQLAEADETDDG